MISLTNALIICILMLSLVACQSTPLQPPVPETKPEPVQTPVVDIEPGPTEPLIVEPPADRYRHDYLAALEQLKLGKSDVITKLEELSQLAPTLEHLFTNLGLAYFKLRNFQQAKSAFERAISQNKEDTVAYNHLGIIARTQGDFEKSREYYENAISVDENYAAAHLNIGILFDIYIQDIKRALVHYQKYQALTDNENKTVAGWIVDIERRLKSG